ncbi:hypothetical protein [Canibacter zhoujuaniae]|uniref:hypothetical protein n=1 Tax=Canibacter zhoujuaniae TaxID=2708343 RepID=UPI00141E79B2|nr:hypothetical protein [Canibacter zhoujuaniae]
MTDFVQSQIPKLVLEAVRDLQNAGARPEVLANWRRRRKLLLFGGKWRLETLGEAYRVGVLLLTESGEIWCAEGQTRAAKRERLGVVSNSQEYRRDLAGLAYDSGYATGTVINFGCTKMPQDEQDLRALAADPQAVIALSGNTLKVRWRAAADLAQAPSLEAYLRDRVSLILENSRS